MNKQTTTKPETHSGDTAIEIHWLNTPKIHSYSKYSIGIVTSLEEKGRGKKEGKLSFFASPTD